MPSSDEVVLRYTQAPDPYLAMCADGPPAWLDELDLHPAPPRHRMGTHALDLDDWLVIDRARPTELALRDRLLTDRRDDVFAVLPTAEAAAVEAHETVRAWLAGRGLLPDRGGRAADGHPLAAAGQLTQEDLCLLVRRDGAWHLDAAVLCFPSVWRLRDKLGRPPSAVHAPVPRYAEELSARVDRLFDRLPVGKPVWRRNLSLKSTHALHLPVNPDRSRPEPAAVLAEGSPWWLRSERQTLRKLPRSGAIVFTIRVQLAPVSVLRARPDRARDLVAAWTRASGVYG
jgi:dimethylamine monooxygenase subunit A